MSRKIRKIKFRWTAFLVITPKYRTYCSIKNPQPSLTKLRLQNVNKCNTLLCSCPVNEWQSWIENRVRVAVHKLMCVSNSYLHQKDAVSRTSATDYHKFNVAEDEFWVPMVDYNIANHVHLQYTKHTVFVYCMYICIICIASMSVSLVDFIIGKNVHF